MRGATERSKALLRPKLSIIGTEAKDPIGVAAECIEAEKKGKLIMIEFASYRLEL